MENRIMIFFQYNRYSYWTTVFFLNTTVANYLDELGGLYLAICIAYVNKILDNSKKIISFKLHEK